MKLYSFILVSLVLISSSTSHGLSAPKRPLTIRSNAALTRVSKSFHWKNRPTIATLRKAAVEYSRKFLEKVPSDWVKLPTWSSLKPLAAVILGVIEGFLIFYLVREITQSLQMLLSEIWKPSSFLSSPESLMVGDSSNAMLSPFAVRELMLWLDTPAESRPSNPSGCSPWLALLALDMKQSCHALSDDDFRRIFSRLTKPQATLLQSSFLRPSKVTFRSIGGLQQVKGALQAMVLSTCQSGHLRQKQQISPYKQLVGNKRQGIALWGAPGCGKTMLIHASANLAGWPTLVVTPSLLQRKWFGESTNQVRTLFGLLSTLGSSIVVLDEVDGLFRTRRESENDANRDLKTEWLQWWDGIATSQLSSNPNVLVLAATNRPWDVDPAIWRRLPQRYYIGIPNHEDRVDLWTRWTVAYQLPPIAPDVLKYMASHTEGYTCSDLFQVLQTACQKGPMVRLGSDGSPCTRLDTDDVQRALQQTPPTRFSSQYIQQVRDFQTTPAVSPQEKTTASPLSESKVWKTPMGNFYAFAFPVEEQVFQALHDYWKTHRDSDNTSEDDIE